MIKRITCLSLGLMMTSGSFALEIMNGKLLHSKETVSGHSRAAFPDIKVVQMPREVAKLANLNNSNKSQSIFTTARMESNLSIISGLEEPKLNLTIQGTASAQIINEHEKDQRYKIKTSICFISPLELILDCAEKNDEILLSSGGSASVGRAPTLEVEKVVYPHYESISIEIQNEDNDIKFTSTDTKYVNSPLIIIGGPLQPIPSK